MKDKRYYDDARYRIDNCTIPVRHIISQYNDGLIYFDEEMLSGDYSEWELHKKQYYIQYLIEYGDSRFIEGSLFLLFNDEGKGTYGVTKDSLNSLKSIIQFYNNEFSIKIDYREVYYKDLEEDVKLLLDGAIINFYFTKDRYIIIHMTSAKTFLS